MVFKITLDIEGEKLNPDKLMGKLSDELVIVESFKPTDTFVKKGKVEQYGFGGMYMMHPNRICYDGDDVEQYEETVIQFLNKNHRIITKNGGSDFCISYEVYFSGDNFSIGLFNRDQLKIISNCNATLSFNGYQMSEEKILDAFGANL